MIDELDNILNSQDTDQICNYIEFHVKDLNELSEDRIAEIIQYPEVVEYLLRNDLLHILSEDAILYFIKDYFDIESFILLYKANKIQITEEMLYEAHRSEEYELKNFFTDEILEGKIPITKNQFIELLPIYTDLVNLMPLSDNEIDELFMNDDIQLTSVLIPKYAGDFYTEEMKEYIFFENTGYLFKMYGLHLLDTNKKEFFLHQKLICNNNETLMSGESLVNNDNIFIIAYGNPQDTIYCLELDEISDNDGYFTNRGNDFKWYKPGTNEVFTEKEDILTLIDILEQVDIEDEDLSNLRYKSITYIQDNLHTLQSNYIPTIRQSLNELSDVDKANLMYLFIFIFELGMYMRRWVGVGKPFPMRCAENESGWDCTKILFSDNKVYSSEDAYNLRLLNTKLETETVTVPLAITKISEQLDKLTPKAKEFFDDLRSYTVRTDENNRNIVKYEGGKLIDEFEQLQGESDAACIQMMSSYLIVSAFYYLKILYRTGISGFDFQKYKFIHTPPEPELFSEDEEDF